MMYVLVLRLVFLNGVQDDWIFETPATFTTREACEKEAVVLLGVFKQDQVKPLAKCVKKHLA